MSDYDCLMQLVKKLELEKVKGRSFLYEDQYQEDETTTGMKVTLGHGIGYNGFFVEFNFDDNGNIVSHGVWE